MKNYTNTAFPGSRSITQPNVAAPTSTPGYSSTVTYFISPQLTINVTVSSAANNDSCSPNTNRSEPTSSEFWSIFNETFWGNFDLQNLYESEEYFRTLKSMLISGKTTLQDLQLAVNDLALGLSDTDALITKTRQFLVSYSNRTSVERCNLRVVGYYTSWGAKEVTKEMLSSLTHVNYAFPDMGPNGTLWIADNSTLRLRNLMKMRGNSPNPKVLISVGGYGKAEFFDDIVRLDKAFNNFTLNLKSLIEQFNLDGVDIDWEHPGAKPDDKALYVKFMRRLRKKLDSWRSAANRTRLLLTFAGAAGSEDLRKGYDLKNLLEGDTVDWVNVMTYDYYGPWSNATGPPAPLFFAASHIPAYSRKLNVHWTMEYYMCAIKDPKKIALGVPFYGRTWSNVMDKPVNKGDPMWRTSTGPEGADVPFYTIKKSYLDKGFMPGYNSKAEASYAWNANSRKYLGYESTESLEKKVEYAIKKRLGGVMIWAIDQDDSDLTMLQTVTHGDICAPRLSDKPLEIPNYFCYEPRWWSTETPAKSGMCGPTAPLINGYYPVCDPGDDNYACCGRWGFCGSGPAFCDCPECTNYARFPEKILEKSVKPTTKEVLWFTMDQSSPELRGRCGYGAPLLNGSIIPICNPDDPLGYCCSAVGICGNQPDACNCPSCVNFREKPDFRFKEKKILGKQWWTWDDSPDLAGKCGPNAPQINGSEAVCDPYSPNAYCCSPYGYCGAGHDFCKCSGCINYRTILA
ncbi:acidic mammalian chitinase-like isoform X2 [Paramacrobiotus metropolitanus]|nr:acidic mammalian chitinase-like isoform X2 [Paramacrobiotus metropolitanus]